MECRSGRSGSSSRTIRKQLARSLQNTTSREYCRIPCGQMFLSGFYAKFKPLYQPSSTPDAELPAYSYASCQLYIGEYEFPPLPGSTEPRKLPYVRSLSPPSSDLYIVSLVSLRSVCLRVPQFGIPEHTDGSGIGSRLGRPPSYRISKATRSKFHGRSRRQRSTYLVSTRHNSFFSPSNQHQTGGMIPPRKSWRKSPTCLHPSPINS